MKVRNPCNPHWWLKMSSWKIRNYVFVLWLPITMSGTMNLLTITIQEFLVLSWRSIIFLSLSPIPIHFQTPFLPLLHSAKTMAVNILSIRAKTSVFSSFYFLFVASFHFHVAMLSWYVCTIFFPKNRWNGDVHVHSQYGSNVCPLSFHHYPLVLVVFSTNWPTSSLRINGGHND